MQIDELLTIVQDTLDERKGIDITTIDVQGKSSVTDFMVLVTGSSERHVKSLCDYVSENVKAKGFMPLGMEGETGSDWVLLDLGDVILHVMTLKAREFYELEKLWTIDLPMQEVSS
jgi:ribosome-associated protein